MKNMKKLLAFVLALSLVFTLAACTSTAKEPTEAATEAPTEAATEAPTEAATEAPTEAATEAPTEAPTEAAAVIKTVADGKLTVATSPDFAPMEFVDASKEGQDKFVGFDLSLAKYFAEQMGLELVVVPMSFDACQTAVAMGTVDMAISGFSWTEARAENYCLSDFYNTGNEDAQVLITLAANGDKFADAANVEGLKVGVQTASLQELLTTEQLTNATKVVFSDLTTALMQLRNGDFDCMAVAEGNAISIIANNEDVAMSGFNFVVDPKYTGNVVMMNKNSVEMLAKVNEMLAQASSEGLYTGWYEAAKALATTGTEVSYDDEGNVAE